MAGILIADDAMFMRKTIRMALEKEGYSVIGEAVDGEDTILKYKELSPDLIILDITMPGMNGLDALKILKDINPAVRIIICSAMGQPGMVVQAIESGAENFIVKPFEAAHLVAAVKKVLG